MMHVEYLILGAGWTSTFLAPLLDQHHLTYASTSTTGRDGTIEFKYDPEQSDPSYFSILPSAKFIIIVFPLTSAESTTRLVESYTSTHPKANPRFVQLGSTGIYQIPDQPLWLDRKSKYDATKPRAIAEDRLIELGGCVLNLSGLWGGARHPRNWISKVGATKEQVAAKTSVHLVHGQDVALSILAVCSQWDRGYSAGQRWMITDGYVYDWYSLFVHLSSSASAAASGEEKPSQPTDQSKWVYEIISAPDSKVKALPRTPEALGRCYDSREFWSTFGVSPGRAGV